MSTFKPVCFIDFIAEVFVITLLGTIHVNKVKFTMMMMMHPFINE